MLTIPNINLPYRIMGIDPGTDTLGVAIIDLDLDTYIPTVIFSQTLFGLKGSRNHLEYAETFGERQAKFYSNQKDLINIINQFRPTVVISESPYMGRFAQAFEALVQCLMMIQSAINTFDPSMSLETIDPSNVKKAVGASGKTKAGGEKNKTKEALLKLPNLINALPFSFDSLDEHSIDAIAVGCYKLKTIYPNIFNI